VGAALAHEWEPPFQGRYPASEVNDGTCPEKPDHLKPGAAQPGMGAAGAALPEPMRVVSSCMLDTMRHQNPVANVMTGILAARHSCYYCCYRDGASSFRAT